MFEKYEKIEKVLYSPCKYFSLKNSVRLSFSSSDKRKLDAIYDRSYNSEKYTNTNTLSSISLKTSEFLVFSYYKDKTNSEEIYVSYPNIDTVIASFNEMLDFLGQDDAFIEKDNSLYLNADYSKFKIKISGLANGKSIVLLPDVIEDKNIGDMSGVTMYLGSPENIVCMNFQVFTSICNYLSNFNLQLSSQCLMNTACLYAINNLLRSDVLKDENTNIKNIVTPRQRKIMKKEIIKDSDIFKEDTSIEEDAIPENLNDDESNIEDTEVIEESDEIILNEKPKKKNIISIDSLNKEMNNCDNLFNEDEE